MDNNSTPTQEKGAQTQPTEQEIQEFVNTVYYQAGQLLFEENYTPQNAVEELVKKGLRHKDAEIVVQNLMQQQHEAKIEAANKNILYGSLCLIGGLIVTFGTMSLGGSTFIVTWGAIVFGGLQLIRGLFQRF